MALIEKQLKIGGMFCAHCQSTIQRRLRKLNDVRVVSVRYQTGGCNPWPIFDADKTVTEDKIQISYDFLKESFTIFAYWKVYSEGIKNGSRGNAPAAVL